MHGRFPLKPLAALRPEPVTAQEKRTRAKLPRAEREAFLARVSARARR